MVFAVGGAIRLRENLTVDEPFLTVAGQTAPEPGITLIGGGLEIRAHDVLLQHLRVRPGDDQHGPDPRNRDGIAVIGLSDGSRDVHDVVIDHCSVSWAVDENVSTWYRGVRDVTVSSSLIAEALHDSLHPEGPHSKGLLVGDHTRRFSLLNSVLAYNADRNPFLKGDTTTLIANVYVHDPGGPPVTLADQENSGPSLLSLEGGHFTRGPDTPRDDLTVNVHGSVHRDSEIYLDDLVSWEAVGAMDSEAPVSVAPLTRLPAADLPSLLLPEVGARPAARDPVDADGDGYTDLEEWLHALAEAVEGPSLE